MINWRLILKVIGSLLYIEAGLMCLCQLVSWLYGEGVMEFTPPIIISLVLGCIGFYAGKDSGTNMSRKDGYIIVSSVWIIFTLIGMLPFLISGIVPDVASAFFETMSGFTSTGATILDDIDSLRRKHRTTPRQSASSHIGNSPMDWLCLHHAHSSLHPLIGSLRNGLVRRHKLLVRHNCHRWLRNSLSTSSRCLQLTCHRVCTHFLHARLRNKLHINILHHPEGTNPFVPA